MAIDFQKLAWALQQRKPTRNEWQRAQEERQMPKISETFGGKFYTAADFNAKGVILTIAGSQMVKVGEDERLVLNFEEADTKGLVINKTNAIALADIYGDDTDDWDGKKIRVSQGRTMYQGKSVACVVVEGSKKEAGKPKKEKPADDEGGDIPF